MGQKPKDITGKRYGMLTALCYSGKKHTDGGYLWVCKCDCGKETLVTPTKLMMRKNNHCGCRSIGDLTGKVFGYLTVLRENGRDPSGNKLWECECVCTKKRNVTTNDLITSGYSCGCLTKGMKPGDSLINNVYGRYKRRAQNKGYGFFLEKDYFKKLILSDCYYCGCSPNQKETTKTSRYVLTRNGIDRLDSSIGYTLENSVPCCSLCNTMKNDTTLQIFLESIKKIYEHRNLNDQCSTSTGHIL